MTSSDPPDLVYLDWNVLIDLLPEDTRETASSGLWPLLVHLRDGGVITVPFSHALVEEAVAFQCADPVETQRARERRLTLLAEISGCAYIEEKGSNAVVRWRDPFELAETVRSVPLAPKAIDQFANFLTDDMVRQFRQTLGLSARKLNHLPAEAVIPEIDRHMKAWHEEQMQSNVSYQEHFARAPFPTHIVGLVAAQNSGDLLRVGPFAGMMTALELCDYHGDPRKDGERKGTARFWDGAHAYWASFGALFISNDRRLRARSRVLYHHHKVDTAVMSSPEAADVLAAVKNGLVTGDESKTGDARTPPGVE